MKEELNRIYRFLHNIVALPIWLLLMIGYFLPLNFSLSYTVAIVFVLFVVNFGLLFHRSMMLLRAVMLVLLLAFSGVLLQTFETTNSNGPANREYYQYEPFLFVVDDYPLEKTNSYLLSCHFFSRQDRELNGKIIVYMPKNPSPKLRPGDRFVAGCRLQEIAPPVTPFAFDYRSFLARQNIYCSTYVTEFSRVDTLNSSLSLIQRSRILRAKLKSTLNNSSLSPEHKSLIMAVTLGDKVDLSSEVKSTFQDSGTMHLLCVSGFHVGIVAVLLFYLFFPVSFVSRIGALLHPLFVVGGLCVFALLSGLTASVLRAVCMCSLYLLAKSMHRLTNPYQILYATALLLFCISPRIVQELGFQLSFAAVTGILYFYPKFLKAFTFKNRIAKYFYSIACVSLAAQLGTMPIVVYYFHAFPVYGVFSNLLAIPLIFVVVLLSFLYFIVSLLGMSTSFVLVPLSTILHILVEGLDLIGKLPFASIKNLNTSFVGLILLLITFVYAIQSVRKRKRSLVLKTIHLLLTTVIVFVLFSTERESVIFPYCRKGKHVILRCDDRLFVVTAENGGSKELDYVLSPIMQYYGLSSYEQLDLKSEYCNEKNELLIYGKTIVTPEFFITFGKSKDCEQKTWKYIHRKTKKQNKKGMNVMYGSSSEWSVVFSKVGTVVKSPWKNRRRK